MSLARTLADWAWSVRAGALPPEALAAVSRHLLDALGCATAAARSGAAVPALAVAALDGPGPCRVPGTALSLPAPAAALATGVLIHALDFDDTHAGGLVHASAPVVAAALAAAQDGRVAQDCGVGRGDLLGVPGGRDRGPSRLEARTGAIPDGAAVFEAIAVGLEVICRLGAAVQHGFHARGFHATGVCGAPAAALVAARLYGLDQATAAHAVGIAVSMSAGSLEFLADGASTKQLHPGLAAQAGVTAARLAAAGATGPATALEGERGLFRLFTGVGVAPKAVSAGLGERWENTRITLKPYPACQLVHASLDAVAAVRDGISAADVDTVHLVVPPDAVAVVCEPWAAKVRPRTAYDAKFSLPWTVAALLVDGVVGVDTFAVDQRGRADLAEMADRVTYAVTDAPDGQPAAAAPGIATLRLRDGRTLEGAVAASRGGPDTPMDDAAVRAKLAANLGDPAAVGPLRSAVDGLADAPDVGALLDAVLAAALPAADRPAIGAPVAGRTGT